VYRVLSVDHTNVGVAVMKSRDDVIVGIKLRFLN
jgi:hypothetical protein